MNSDNVPVILTKYNDTINKTNAILDVPRWTKEK